MATSANVKRKAAKSRTLKLTRFERAALIERRLFDAAIQVVGADGYAEATVSRITNIAGVAQGTFYNYFPSRQDLLDRLLPNVGARLLDYIKERLKPELSQLDRETMRFRCFFDFLDEVPEFLRILSDAQVFAPVAFERHMSMLAQNYMHALREDGVSEDRFTDEELEVVVYALMGTRSYLCQKFSYTNNTVHRPPEAVFSAYRKLLGEALLGSSD